MPRATRGCARPPPARPTSSCPSPPARSSRPGRARLRPPAGAGLRRRRGLGRGRPGRAAIAGPGPGDLRRGRSAAAPTPWRPGTGDDSLKGCAGDDTYGFTRGDGRDGHRRRRGPRQPSPSTATGPTSFASRRSIRLPHRARAHFRRHDRPDRAALRFGWSRDRRRPVRRRRPRLTLERLRRAVSGRPARRRTTACAGARATRPRRRPGDDVIRGGGGNDV